MSRCVALLGSLVVLLTTGPALAKVYECQDGQGGIYMQDRPCSIPVPDNKPLPQQPTPRLTPPSTTRPIESTPSPQSIPKNDWDVLCKGIGDGASQIVLARERGVSP